MIIYVTLYIHEEIFIWFYGVFSTTFFIYGVKQEREGCFLQCSERIFFSLQLTKIRRDFPLSTHSLESLFSTRENV